MSGVASVADVGMTNCHNGP